MKIDLIAGARPNFVKIASIIHAISNLQSSINFRLIHTGQHYDHNLSGSFFENLELPQPDVNLNSGSGSQANQTANIMIAYEKSLNEFKPDLCIVVGDVTSSMACAITAKKMNLQLAHIEAGIRSGDHSMPEEINRILIDSISDYFFTTSRSASENLLKAGKKIEQIHFVGNTMIDTLLKFRSKFKKPKVWEELNLLDKNYFLLTLHRPSNVDIRSKFENILNAVSNHINIPIIFPCHPRAIKKIENLKNLPKNIHIIEPLEYLEYNYLTERAKGVITDSGGITEETTILNIPCISLRDSTERPETVEIGTNELVGNDFAKLELSVKKILDGKWKNGASPELWDGKSGERIIKILEQIKLSH